MKKYLSLCTVLLLPLFGDLQPSKVDDLDALKAWIAAKRQVTIKESAGNLSISGDVRAEYLSNHENKNGCRNIGMGSQLPGVSQNQFDVEFNLLLDYRTNDTWGSVKVEFDNDMGALKGSLNRLSLERALVGGRFYQGDNFTIDAEFGRRHLLFSFDSRMQFASFMDGAFFRYSHLLPNYASFYLQGGPFVVNEQMNQFAYIVEASALDILNTGGYLKYSLIDWDTKKLGSEIASKEFSFMVHQISGGYNFSPSFLEKPCTIYSAFLINSSAKQHAFLEDKLLNKGFYVGMSIGKIKRKGDWSFDLNYQYAQPQTIPDFDVAGIGTGNSDKIGLYSYTINDRKVATTRENAAGRSNFQGIKAELLLGVSQNFTISQSVKLSRSLEYLPTQYKYGQYRLELIYSW